jgi:hypothetical protein
MERSLRWNRLQRPLGSITSVTMGSAMSRHNEMPSMLSASRSHLANLSASCLQGGGEKIEPRLFRVERAQTSRIALMTAPAVRNEIRIDHVSSAAICEEIGDRLRTNLTGEPVRLPQHMMMLVEQMEQNDRVSTIHSDTNETAVNRQVRRPQQSSLQRSVRPKMPR